MSVACSENLASLARHRKLEIAAPRRMRRENHGARRMMIYGAACGGASSMARVSTRLKAWRTSSRGGGSSAAALGSSASRRHKRHAAKEIKRQRRRRVASSLAAAHGKAISISWLPYSGRQKHSGVRAGIGEKNNAMATCCQCLASARACGAARAARQHRGAAMTPWRRRWRKTGAARHAVSRSASRLARVASRASKHLIEQNGAARRGKTSASLCVAASSA